MTNETNETNNAIVPVKLGARSIVTMSDTEISRITMIAKLISNSTLGYKRTLSETDLALCMFKGAEIGLPPMASIDFIDVISGKPALKPQGMLALINASGMLEDIEIIGDNIFCTVTMTRMNKTPHAETFTMENAVSMGLSGRDSWKKQPATMLKWRAVAACARVVFPDVIQGMYTPEELGAEMVIDSETLEDMTKVVREVDEIDKIIQFPQQTQQPQEQPQEQPQTTNDKATLSIINADDGIGEYNLLEEAITSQYKISGINNDLSAKNWYDTNKLQFINKLEYLEQGDADENEKTALALVGLIFPSQWVETYKSGKDALLAVREAYNAANETEQTTDETITPYAPTPTESETIEANVVDITVKTKKNGEEYLAVQLDSKTVPMASSWSRSMWIDAGICPSKDSWKILGKVDSFVPARVKVRKNENGYWNVIQVVAKDVPF